MEELCRSTYKLYVEKKFGIKDADLDKSDNSVHSRWVLLVVAVTANPVNPLTSEAVMAEIEKIQLAFQPIADFDREFTRSIK